MTIEQCDKIALKGSLWDILRSRFPDNAEFQEAIKELRNHKNYITDDLFDRLNRTRNQSKTSQKKAVRAKFEKKWKFDWRENLPSGHENYIINKTDHLYLTRTVEEKKLKKSRHLTSYLECAHELHLRYGIPLKAFKFNKKHREKFNWGSQKTVDLKQHHRKDDRDLFQKKYKDAFARPLQRLSFRAYIYDYLESFDNKHITLNSYYEVHDELYRDIEDRLKISQKLNYCRVIALPLRTELSEKHSPFDLLKIFLLDCSIPLFAHISRCLNDDSIRKTTENPDIPNGFYVINRCTRTYQYAILDYTISSEYYRRNSRGECVPDILFVEPFQDDSTLYDINKNDFESLFGTKKEGTPEVDKPLAIDSLDEIEKALPSLIKEVPEARKAMVQLKINILNSILNDKTVSNFPDVLTAYSNLG